MPTAVRFRFRTRNRGYIPFDAIYPTPHRYESDAEIGFPAALALARQLGFLAEQEIVDSVDAEVWSNNVEYIE
jgi:hypothetical protein